MSDEKEHGQTVIDRREAIRRVSALLGGAALVGGTNLLTACEKAGTPARETTAAAGAAPAKPFTTQEVALLDEIAETILPATKTPGAKAAKTGAFMALMVTDGYSPRDQQIFREGMRKVNEATQQAHKVDFMAATPEQRLAVLTQLDREQKRMMDQRDAAIRAKKGLPPVPVNAEAGETGKEGDAYLSDQRKENAGGQNSNPAPAITADAPPHYFRMMKELALLGYFTSEIGCTQAQRYEETPGKWEPCIPYKAGELAWAAHA
ncbi:MAG TPA: gluconate 2-dehydrogenase subunit 3 family protein [Gemmatimonadaceae bacterium]|nr:gluconate 2-dehydrogenase subunit 3 family protein [Gemmatimonadaceae bacterium]